MNDHMTSVGVSVDELDTPALLVDLDIMEANIARAAEECRANGIQWRPHFKGQKTPEIVRKEMEAGAIGSTCAKLGEAEVLVEAGITDLLVANQIVGPQKIARLIALIGKGDVKVAVDSRAVSDPIGAAAAAATGARKTVVMSGDGGFFLNVGELWTAVQEKLDMCVIVMNDNGYGVIKRIQDATQGRRFFADLQSPDIGKLAALSDIPFFKVQQAEKFGETVAKALAIKGLTMVEVDMNAVGEFPPYFPFNLLPKK